MAKRRDTPPPPDDLTYEQAIVELESIIDRIEQGEVGLEESLTQFRRGEALLKRCRAILNVAEQQVREVERTGEAPRREPEETECEDAPF
jgi:exodeoxyribonuclease VII small subunit